MDDEKIAEAAGGAPELGLEAAITKLDKYHLLIPDDIAYVTTILEMNVESFRRKAALKRKRGPGD
jgi:hypothetical protein